MLKATAAPQLLVSGANPDQEPRRAFYERLASLDAVQRTGLVVGVGVVPMHVRTGKGTAMTRARTCRSMASPATAWTGPT